MIRNAEVGAQTQEDLVAARLPVQDEYQVEQLTFPTIAMLHTLREGEIVEFLTAVLRSRQNISEIVFKFGNYKTTEVRSNAARSNALHTVSYENVANILTTVLLSSGNKCVGFRAVVTRDGEVTSSKVFALMADRPAVGPEFNEQGEVIKQGDSEFDPTLTVTYRLV